jgi:pullulanase
MKRLLVILAVLSGLALVFTSAQSNRIVTLPGTIQKALGGKEWEPKDEITRMTEVSADVYEFVAAFPKGKYEYKVAINQSWDENYGKNGEKGGANLTLDVPNDNTIVKFVFNYATKKIMDSLNNPTEITAPATIPARVIASAAPIAEGTTRFIVHYKRTRGDYEGWNLWVWTDGADGRSYPFNRTDEFGLVATIDLPIAVPRVNFIVRLGDWQAKDTEADRFATTQNGKAEVWLLQGNKEVFSSRAKVDAFAASAAPPRGEPAFLDSPSVIRAWIPKAATPESFHNKIKLTMNGKPLAIKSLGAGGAPVLANTDSIDPTKVVLPGTIQGALGGADWNPNGDITRMTEVSKGVFEFVAAFPKGNYEYKVAKGGNWEENYGADFAAGGGNIGLSVPANGTIVRFVVDFNRNLVKDSINNKDIIAPATVPPRAAIVAKPTTGPVQVLAINLEKPITPKEISNFIEMTIEGDLPRTVYAREVLDSTDYQYGKDDLGNRYSKNQTVFKVWSPVSSSAELFVFDNLIDGPSEIADMQRGANGVWFATIKGDLHGKYYQYRFKSYGETRVAADINSYAASSDSTRSMVVDLSRTNPKNWTLPKPMQRPQTESILYELHVRDLTSDPSSGVPEALRGKYLGFAQTGTKAPNGSSSGLDYLKNLGVTDLHLLPIQNFNPKNSGVYNWGYETNLFNVPEEQYSTDPNDPIKTILETKTMFQAIRNAGMRVIMDVVYNHTVPAKGEESAFWETVPYYYFRTNDQGQVLNESGVGNAMHDDRPMVRKYIRESVLFWTKEYGVDGYRFDLIGMFTKGTVTDFTKALRKIRPDIVLYGEPWTGGGPTRFGKGAQRGTEFAVFNDNIRNAMRGDLDGTKAGFVMGGLTSLTAIKKGVVGSINYADSISDFTDSPLETINYISAHDNLTLWDKMDKAMTDANIAMKARAVQLGGAIVLTSQGVPFLEGGVEMGRTKGGNNNSYNSGDSANKYDWSRAAQFPDVQKYYQGLIAIRKAHPAFKMTTTDQIRKHLKFLPDSSLPNGVVAYTLDGAAVKDSWKRIVVILHGTRGEQTMQLPAGTWNVAANGLKASNSSLGKVSGSLKLEPLSAYILYQ